VTGPGERLVTVVLTVAVPAEADAEDAAGLVADEAVSTALQVVSAAGVEGHLPVPGSLVLRRGGGQPWRVEAVSKEVATLTDLSGVVVQARLTRLVPDPLAASGGGARLLCGAASGGTTADREDVADESETGRCLDAGLAWVSGLVGLAELPGGLLPAVNEAMPRWLVALLGVLREHAGARQVRVAAGGLRAASASSTGPSEGLRRPTWIPLTRQRSPSVSARPPRRCQRD